MHKVKDDNLLNVHFVPNQLSNLKHTKKDKGEGKVEEMMLLFYY